MAALQGTVLASKIVPTNSLDQYATHVDIYGEGGYRSVATITDRDGIPSPRRKVGMLCYVEETDRIYKLRSDLSTWEELIASLGTGTPSGGSGTVTGDGVIVDKIAQISYYDLTGTTVVLSKEENLFYDLVNRYVIDGEGNEVEVLIRENQDFIIIESNVDMTGLRFVAKAITVQTKIVELAGVYQEVVKSYLGISNVINKFVEDEFGQIVELPLRETRELIVVESNAEMSGLKLIIEHT